MSAAKWKIQSHSVDGWADLKVSIDGGPYVDDHYDNIDDALAELREMVLFSDSNDGTEFRVVKTSVPQEDDIYKGCT